VTLQLEVAAFEVESCVSCVETADGDSEEGGI